MPPRIHRAPAAAKRSRSNDSRSSQSSTGPPPRKTARGDTTTNDTTKARTRAALKPSARAAASAARRGTAQQRSKESVWQQLTAIAGRRAPLPAWLRLVEVPSDGLCFYHAIRTILNHDGVSSCSSADVRREVTDYIRAEFHRPERKNETGFVKCALIHDYHNDRDRFNAYIAKKLSDVPSDSDRWADEVFLSAAADVYRRNVFLYQNGSLMHHAKPTKPSKDVFIFKHKDANHFDPYVIDDSSQSSTGLPPEKTKEVRGGTAREQSTGTIVRSNPHLFDVTRAGVILFIGGGAVDANRIQEWEYKALKVVPDPPKAKQRGASSAKGGDVDEGFVSATLLKAEHAVFSYRGNPVVLTKKQYREWCAGRKRDFSDGQDVLIKIAPIGEGAVTDVRCAPQSPDDLICGALCNVVIDVDGSLKSWYFPKQDDLFNKVFGLDLSNATPPIGTRNVKPEVSGGGVTYRSAQLILGASGSGKTVAAVFSTHLKMMQESDRPVTVFLTPHSYPFDAANPDCVKHCVQHVLKAVLPWRSRLPDSLLLHVVVDECGGVEWFEKKDTESVLNGIVQGLKSLASNVFLTLAGTGLDSRTVSLGSKNESFVKVRMGPWEPKQWNLLTARLRSRWLHVDAEFAELCAESKVLQCLQKNPRAAMALLQGVLNTQVASEPLDEDRARLDTLRWQREAQKPAPNNLDEALILRQAARVYMSQNALSRKTKYERLQVALRALRLVRSQPAIRADACDAASTIRRFVDESIDDEANYCTRELLRLGVVTYHAEIENKKWRVDSPGPIYRMDPALTVMLVGLLGLAKFLVFANSPSELEFLVALDEAVSRRLQHPLDDSNVPILAVARCPHPAPAAATFSPAAFLDDLTDGGRNDAMARAVGDEPAAVFPSRFVVVNGPRAESADVLAAGFRGQAKYHDAQAKSRAKRLNLVEELEKAGLVCGVRKNADRQAQFVCFMNDADNEVRMSFVTNDNAFDVCGDIRSVQPLPALSALRIRFVCLGAAEGLRANDYSIVAKKSGAVTRTGPDPCPFAGDEYYPLSQLRL